MYKKLMQMRNKSLLIIVLIGAVALLVFGIAVSAQQISGSKMRLGYGWNLISVTPPMEGKTVHQFSDNSTFNDECNISRAFIFDSTLGWQIVKPTKGNSGGKIETFVQENVGHGMWVFNPTEGSCFIKCGVSSCER